MKVLLIDNYDSFTYNLYQYLGEASVRKGIPLALDVKRNDALTLAAIRAAQYDRIILSPGPGHPADDAYIGVCRDVIVALSTEIPVIGICLGMQAMVQVLGGTIVRATEPMHGKDSFITHDQTGLCTGLPSPLSVMRYHSLIVHEPTLPDKFIVTARTIESGEIMGIRHRTRKLIGVQFHPESFATEGGKQMVENMLLTE